MLNRNTLKYSTAILAALMMTGCANLNSIYRQSSFGEGANVQFVDGKQRGLIYNKGKGRFCSEPAPDVFSVYATSVAAEANAEKGVGFGAALGISSAETGATIERTQVINMLRESMFRTCERFMNKAMTNDQMNIQTARDQRVMVATLAIEQLTGVVKRRPTILSSKASARMNKNAGKLIDKIVEAEEKVEALEVEVKTAETNSNTETKNYSDLFKPTDAAADAKPFCDTAKAAPVVPPPPPPPVPTPQVTPVMVLVGAAPAKPAAPVVPPVPAQPAPKTATPEQLQACAAQQAKKTGAQETLNKKKAELEEAKSKVKKLEGRLDMITDTFLTASGSGDGDPGNSPQNAKHLATVAKTVGEITKLAFSDLSEFTFACVEAIKDTQKPKLQEACENLFASMVKEQASLKNKNAAEQNAQAENLRYIANPVLMSASWFDQFWNKVKKAGTETLVDNSAVKSEIALFQQSGGVILSFDVKSLNAATNEIELKSAFAALDRRTKAGLATQ